MAGCRPHVRVLGSTSDLPSVMALQSPTLREPGTRVMSVAFTFGVGIRVRVKIRVRVRVRVVVTT